MFVRGLWVGWQTKNIPDMALILVNIGIQLRFPHQLLPYYVISQNFCVMYNSIAMFPQIPCNIEKLLDEFYSPLSSQTLWSHLIVMLFLDIHPFFAMHPSRNGVQPILPCTSSASNTLISLVCWGYLFVLKDHAVIHAMMFHCTSGWVLTASKCLSQKGLGNWSFMPQDPDIPTCVELFCTSCIVGIHLYPSSSTPSFSRWHHSGQQHVWQPSGDVLSWARAKLLHKPSSWHDSRHQLTPSNPFSLQKHCFTMDMIINGLTCLRTDFWISNDDRPCLSFNELYLNRPYWSHFTPVSLGKTIYFNIHHCPMVEVPNAIIILVTFDMFLFPSDQILFDEESYCRHYVKIRISNPCKNVFQSFKSITLNCDTSCIHLVNLAY